MALHNYSKMLPERPGVYSCHMVGGEPERVNVLRVDGLLYCYGSTICELVADMSEYYFMGPISNAGAEPEQQADDTAVWSDAGTGADTEASGGKGSKPARKKDKAEARADAPEQGDPTLLGTPKI